MEKKISRRDFIKVSARTGLLAAVAGPGILRSASPGDYDLVIRNGTLVDGTGTDPFPADIGIRGERIAFIGRIGNVRGRKVIDAANRVVSPGFIDIHSHSDFELLINPKAESKIRQGVTTELVGNCGSSAFPLKQPLEEEDKRMAEKHGILVDWTDLAGYRKALSREGMALNLAALVGQGTLRRLVVGEERRPPTPGELERMQELVARAMEQGAFGLSTGLEYTPGGFAEADEIISLCRVVASYGGFYATHMRSEDKAVVEAVAEAVHIAEAAGLPLQISHFKAVGRPNWWKLPMMIDLVERAAERGLDVAADRYPYIAYSTGLTILFPKEALDGGMACFLERLRDQKTRESLKAPTLEKVEGYGWDNILITSVNREKNRPLVGKNLREAADQAGKNPYTFLCDLLLDEGQDVSHVGFGMSEENTDRVLAHPLVMLGSDGSSLAPYGPLSEGKPHPRNYGAFPRLLGTYVRERKVLSLSEAVRKVTSMPAARMGLEERGKLAEGFFADIVVFDPGTISDRATFTHPHQYPAGIDYVLVNGTVVVEGDTHTGWLPGKFLLGPRKRPA